MPQYQDVVRFLTLLNVVVMAISAAVSGWGFLFVCTSPSHRDKSKSYRYQNVNHHNDC